MDLLNTEAAQLKALLFPPREEEEKEEEPLRADILSHEVRLIEVLQQIAVSAEADQHNQLALGNITIIRLICGVLDNKASTPALRHAALGAWMKLLRRQSLVKASTCWETCDLSEEHIISLVPCMRLHFADELVALYGCSLIMMLASDNDSRQFKFGLIGTPKVVVAILNTHAQNPQISEMALRATRNLSSLDQVACIFAQAQAGAALRYLLQDPAQPPNVVEAALYAVVNLSFDAENATSLGKEGVCEALVEVAGRMLSQDQLVLEICWALRNLSTVDDNSTLLSAIPLTAPMLLDVLRATCDPEVMQMALWGTANLCCDRAFSKQMLRSDALEVFSRDLHFGEIAFPEDGLLGPVFEAVSFAIYNLASVFAVMVEEGAEAGEAEEAALVAEEGRQLREQLGQMGGCQLICVIFQRYVDREAMAESCSRSLHLLADQCVPNQVALAHMGGLSALATAAWRHRTVPETVFLAWKAVLTVCSRGNAATRDLLAGEEGLLSQTAALVKHYKEIDEIVILGGSILLILPYFTADKKAVLRAGVFIDDEDKIVVKEDREAMLTALEVYAITEVFPLEVAAPQESIQAMVEGADAQAQAL